MIEKLAFSTGYIILICLVLSASLLIKNWRTLSITFHFFALYVFWNLGIEIGARVVQYFEANNLPLLHIYTLGELILFSLFYRCIHPFNRWSKNIFIIFLTISSLLLVCNSIFLQSIYGFNSYSKTFVQLILIALAVLYFYYLNEGDPARKSEEKGIRLINTAVLIYFSGSLFVFMFSDYFLRHGMKLHGGFWLFNAVLNLIFQILVLIAIWRTVSGNRKYLS